MARAKSTGVKNKKARSGHRRRKKKVHDRKKVHVPNKQIRDRWDQSKTTKQNYEALGLSGNPNKSQPKAANPVALDPGPARKKRDPYLTTAEVITYRELVLKHDDDYEAMFRDMKLNPYQHGAKVLKKKCELYLEKYAFRDPLWTMEEDKSE